jgi:hypothetical protein
MGEIPVIFGIVEMRVNWLAMKIILIALSLTLAVTPPFSQLFFWFGIALALYFSVGTIHEFVHAIETKRCGGEIRKIYLGYPNQYIDYKVSSIISEKRVYRAGAMTECITMALVVGLLVCGIVTTKNPFYIIVILCWVWLFISSEILPPSSDFRQYFAREKKQG